MTVSTSGLPAAAALSAADLAMLSQDISGTLESRKVDLGTLRSWLLVKNNLTATIDPGATDDSAAGYEKESKWLNNNTNEWFICSDPTAGAAVWEPLSLSADDLGSAAVAAADRLLESRWCTVTEGTNDAYELTTAYAPAAAGALYDGMLVRFRAPTSNDGSVTINLDALGAQPCVPIKTGAAMPAGYLRTDVDTVARWDAANSRWIVDREPEEGTNANGSFVRYASGLARARSFLGGGSASVVWTYPLAFVGNPTIMPSVGATTARHVTWFGISSTSVTIYRWDDTGAASTPGTFQTAEGDWYA